jgi:hypothetical protein
MPQEPINSGCVIPLRHNREIPKADPATHH